MRSAVFLLALVLLSPAATNASPIVDHYYSTGQLEFGTWGAYQRGWGPYGLSIGAHDLSDDFDISDTTYEMSSGPFIAQELAFDEQGEVVKSTYFYGPGLLTIAFRLKSWATGDVTHGEFRAPVNMTVTIDEGTGFAGSDSLFILGPGEFDASIAQLFGIRPRTIGGTVVDDFVDVSGDYTSPDRIAYDVAYFLVDVPEPSGVSLSLLGLAASLLRRRHTRR